MRLVACVALLGACSASGQVWAGAAKRVITPDVRRHGPVYLAGFGQNRVATGIHDDLWARCMAFRASSRPLVVCGVDAIGLFLDDVEKIRAQVKADVIVTATHNHETPDTMGLWGPGLGQTGINEAYNRRVIDLTAQAANDALAVMKPARLRLGKVQSPELDALIHDTRPPLRHDSELTVLVAESAQSGTIGILTNWSNHPEALGSKNTEITADYLAYFHGPIEKEFGGVSVFCNGAVGGMQSPLGAKVTDPDTGAPAREGTFRFAELVGERVARFASQAVRKARETRVRSMVFRETTVEIPMVNVNYQQASKAGLFGDRKEPAASMATRTPVGYVAFLEAGRLPVLEIALIPGEMYPELAVGGIERYPGADFADAPFETPVKQQMTAPYRMLFGLANDEIGYILPKAEWDEKAPWLQNAAKRWYGEVNSVGPEAGPIINAAFGRLVGGGR